MRALSTGDIPLDDLRDLTTQLGPDFGMEIDKRQVVFKSIDPPSWVVFFAEADWWIKVLLASAGLYFAEIVKEAGKDTWKNRAKILSAAAATGDRVRQLAVALASFRRRLAERTRISIGLPTPNDYDGTRFELVGADVDELVVQLAAFVHYLPALAVLMREERLDRVRVATGIRLRMRADFSLEVSWQDSSLKKQTRVLTFDASENNP
jgi:hypothetical protein